VVPWIIRVFRLLFSIKVVEVAENSSNPCTVGRNSLRSQVVLAKLSTGIPEGLQGFCYGDVLGAEPQVSARKTNL